MSREIPTTQGTCPCGFIGMVYDYMGIIFCPDCSPVEDSEGEASPHDTSTLVNLVQDLREVAKLSMNYSLHKEEWDQLEAFFAEEEEDTERAPTPTPDPSACPNCGGPSDNGHDRCYPPNVYHCTRCEKDDQP